MAVSVKQYAQSLYESLADKNQTEVKDVLNNFVKVLGGRRELIKINGIIARFGEIWNKEKGEIEAELVSARALGSSAQEVVIEYLKNKTGVKTVKLRERVQPDLIGGFILNYGDQVIDGSLRNNLEILRNKISN
ncbi:ATP synthase F1 subunit delta [Candidatus Falkowbacteria bacterium]|uniref:ATP synthase subunit delta n=1 Tax=Candidatus Falkowbacteria bacterium CG10_big_fil_rev_8_21_14_0_10_37_18 TaxID=1974562 RepID=A0A2H0V953_9BACT|nr:ATP synthase F1 subunit delta [Candidatus Falkowbacteria bacterium]NCQ12737.1 ATP synthase F1 subunit delta [Candidatus Falkowbacteria bacterium]OIO05374.1 MAG: ATP synthase F1 subunit delta [Candidatus Falkowbacteria bacterium CG1_02_37_21]PIR95605.1 MAG: ATP synthase F1 subunit delta [Candidatus Falkowbacteria bacterium CG10_big_fil_rev_8_21_14_0_10_37_18]